MPKQALPHSMQHCARPAMSPLTPWMLMAPPRPMTPWLSSMLLCFACDAVACSISLDVVLSMACVVSFFSLDVDGCTSTNDTVNVMANGASGVVPSQEELDEEILKAWAFLGDQLQVD